MARVLVLGAGGPAGVNTLQALKAAGHELFASDRKPEHLVWTDAYAERAEGIPNVDLVLAQPDSEVLRLTGMQLPRWSRTFQPSQATVLACQDKFEAGLAWRRAELRRDRTVLVDSDRALGGLIFPLWLRARHGAGAKGAILARTWSEAYHWFSFWRGRDPRIDFVAEAFLPGRDLSWASLWYEGALIADFARERLEYLYPHLTPEGLTGTPTRARIIQDLQLSNIAARSVLAIDPKPHGIFCVDLREDRYGIPRPTEINAGRFSTTVGLWSLWRPESNLVAAAVDLALTGSCNWEALPEGLTLSRHIDCGHQFTGALVTA